MKRDATSIRDMLLPWRRRRGSKHTGDASGEEVFRALAGDSYGGIAILHRGRISETNRAFAAMFGYERSEVRGESLSRFLAPGAGQDLGAGDPVETLGLKKDGTTFDVEVRQREARHGGRIVRGVVVLDITERRRVEEIRRQRDVYEGMLIAQSELGEGLVIVDGGRIWHANGAFCEISGYDLEELKALSDLTDLVAEEERDRILDLRGRRLSGQPVETRYATVLRRKDGRRVDVEVAVRLVGAGDGSRTIAVIRDVTGRREAEKRLVQAEARYRTLVEQIPAVAYTQVPRSGRQVASSYLSPQAERILGYTPEEFASDPKPWANLIHPDDRERVLAEDRRADETGEPFAVEYRLLTGDDGVMWVRDEAVLVDGVEGQPPCWQGILTDITAKRGAEEALKDSEQRFRSMVQNSSDIITLAEADGTVRYVSPAIERVLGYGTGDSIGKNIFELVHPEDAAGARRLFSGALRNPRVAVSIAVRMRHRDGSWRHIETTGANRLDDPGVDAIVLNSRDVTERELTEEALKESERRYAELLSNSRAFVYRCLNEPGWPNEFASDYALELTGYAPEDLLVGGTVRYGDLIVEGDRRRVWEEVQTALASGEHFKIGYEIRHRDGTPRYVEEYGKGIRDEEGEVEAIEGLVYDVTELKRAEERLREAEARYRALIEQIPAVTYIHTVGDTGRSTYVSPQVEAMLGYTQRESTADPNHWIEITHPDDRERVLAEDRRTDETGEPFRMEYRQFAKDGRVVWVRDEAVLVRDQAGRPLYWLGVQHDVTERRRTEEALKESELRLRTVITSVPVVLFALDRGGVFTLSEGRGLEALGLRSGEAVGRSVSELYGDRPETLADVDRALAGEEFSVVRELAGFVFETWYSPLRTSTGEVSGVIGVATDITERKRAEEDVKEANRRLAELAILKADFTAMVAHELDTPLAVIRGYADMLATGELDPAEQSRSLDRIQTETDLLEALVADVRVAAAVERDDFAIEARYVPVGELLGDAAAFVQTLPGAHPLTVEVEASGEVRADPYRIGQALRNLLSNAAKYSPPGTPIELRATPGKAPGRVRIEVADRGAGIDPHDASRIFEKFGRGRDGAGKKVAGAGLGLYLTRRILQAHGSDLALETEPGRGAVFSFELEGPA